MTAANDAFRAFVVEQSGEGVTLAGDLPPRGLAEDIEEVTLESIESALDAIVAGRARGRWIVRAGAAG